MYNPDNYVVPTQIVSSGPSKYGTNVTYSDGVYTLVSPYYSYNDAHHYTCGTGADQCEKVYYAFYNNYFIELNDGRNINDVLKDMLNADDVNKEDSTVKAAVDDWYSHNMTDYTEYLEDTIFCNDRSVYSLGGWKSDGGSISGNAKITFTPNHEYHLTCSNETDQFSLSNPKAKLTYPVGLITEAELRLVGNPNVMKTGEYYWTSSPLWYGIVSYISVASAYGGYHNYAPSTELGVRPVVSLKSNVIFNSGDGSKEHPYTNAELLTYSITVNNDDVKGSIDFYVEDLTKILEGRVVKFRVSPNSGFNLDEYELVTDDGQVLGVSKTEEEFVYEFIMPAKNVVLTIQYKEQNVEINPLTVTGGLLLLLGVISLSVLLLLIVGKKLAYK